RGRSMSLIAWRVSADPVVKPAAQTRAESRVLNVRKQKRERDRLSAGGRRIRTLGPRWGTRFFRDISESGHDKPSWPREPHFTVDNHSFTVHRVIAPEMMSTPGHRAYRRRQRAALPAWSLFGPLAGQYRRWRPSYRSLICIT